jgi:glycosyltransferase involved in cell wall biosynthesis
MPSNQHKVNQHKVVILLGTLNALNFFPSSFNPIEINPTPTWELLVSDHGSTDRTIEHKDAPIFRPIQQIGIIHSPILGGLHHHYGRI